MDSNEPETVEFPPVAFPIVPEKFPLTIADDDTPLAETELDGNVVIFNVTLPP